MRDFVAAAEELTLRQQELIPRVEARIGFAPYDYWVDRGRLSPRARWRLRLTALLGRHVSPRFGDWRESGVTDDGAWAWMFHGLECDIANRHDGRHVRVDFGPGGRLDTFTGYGVLQFVVATRRPWRTFPSLRAQFAAREGADELRPNAHDRMCELEASARSKGWLEPSAPELANAVERFTRPHPDGFGMSVDLPSELRPRSSIDVALCSRLVVTALGRETIRER